MRIAQAGIVILVASALLVACSGPQEKEVSGGPQGEELTATASALDPGSEGVGGLSGESLRVKGWPVAAVGKTVMTYTGEAGGRNIEQLLITNLETGEAAAVIDPGVGTRVLSVGAWSGGYLADTLTTKQEGAGRSWTQTLFAYDTDGAVVWSAIYAAGDGERALAYSSMDVQQGVVVLCPGEYEGAAVGMSVATGEQLWSSDGCGTVLKNTSTGEAASVAVIGSGRVFGIDPGTGAHSWEVPFRGTLPAGGAVLTADALFLGEETVSIEDGSVRESPMTEGVKRLLGTSDGFVVQRRGEVALLEADGSDAWVVTGEIDQIASFKGTLYFTTGHQMVVLNSASGEQLSRIDIPQDAINEAIFPSFGAVLAPVGDVGLAYDTMAIW